MVALEAGVLLTRDLIASEKAPDELLHLSDLQRAEVVCVYGVIHVHGHFRELLIVNKYIG